LEARGVEDTFHNIMQSGTNIALAFLTCQANLFAIDSIKGVTDV
jgi:hypothetical protein